MHSFVLPAGGDMTPTVTVGLSFNNPGRFFKLALQSLLSQTFQDWELVAIDDGSKDASLAMAASIQDSRIRLFSDGRGKGSNVRGNELVAKARGKYFFIMDADDVMHPERLQVQHQYLERSSPNTVVGSFAYAIDAEDRVLGMKPAPLRQHYGYEARHSFINPTVAAAVSWFRANPYSEEFFYHRAQDAELWCRTTRHTTFVNLAQPLLFYREVGNVSLQKYVGSAIGLINVLYDHYRYPTPRFLMLVALELARSGVTAAAYSTALWQRMIQSRYLPLNPGQKQEAHRILEVIRRTLCGVDTPSIPSLQV